MRAALVARGHQRVGRHGTLGQDWPCRGSGASLLEVSHDVSHSACAVFFIVVAQASSCIHEQVHSWVRLCLLFQAKASRTTWTSTADSRGPLVLHRWSQLVDSRKRCWSVARLFPLELGRCLLSYHLAWLTTHQADTHTRTQFRSRFATQPAKLRVHSLCECCGPAVGRHGYPDLSCRFNTRGACRAGHPGAFGLQVSHLSRRCCWCASVKQWGRLFQHSSPLRSPAPTPAQRISFVWTSAWQHNRCDYRRWNAQSAC